MEMQAHATSWWRNGPGNWIARLFGERTQPAQGTPAPPATGFWQDFARKPIDAGEGAETPHFELGSRPAILVPTDFSPASLRAVDCAVRLAKKTKSHLIFLHVVYLNVTPYGPGNPDWLKAALCREAQQKAGSLAASVCAAGVPAECLIEEGAPSDVIPRIATQLQAQIIVMAATKRGMLARLFRQKTVEHVVRDADCPVLVLQTNLKEGIL